jgi:zinc transporter ZupT
MGAAFGWGTLAACSLVIGALVALWFKISLCAIGLIMGFGAGVLISAVAFDLVEEAASKSSGQGAVAVGIFAGLSMWPPVRIELMIMQLLTSGGSPINCSVQPLRHE